MEEVSGGQAFAAAWIRSRQDKASRMYQAAQFLRLNRFFDSCAHSAYYSVFHAVIARAVELKQIEIRVTPKRYRHGEIPGLAAKCIRGILVVTQGGRTKNLSPADAILELQAIRRFADYEYTSNSEENGERGFQLASAILATLA